MIIQIWRTYLFFFVSIWDASVTYRNRILRTNKSWSSLSNTSAHPMRLFSLNWNMRMPQLRLSKMVDSRKSRNRKSALKKSFIFLSGQVVSISVKGAHVSRMVVVVAVHLSWNHIQQNEIDVWLQAHKNVAQRVHFHLKTSSHLSSDAICNSITALKALQPLCLLQSFRVKSSLFAIRMAPILTKRCRHAVS